MVQRCELQADPTGPSVGPRGGELVGGYVNGVLRTLQNIELGVDRLFESFGFLTENIFRDHFVAGMSTE